MTYEYLFLIFLAITIAIEMAVLILMVRYYLKIGPEKIPISLLIFAGFVSFATLPYVWFLLPQLIVSSYILYVIVAEIIVLISEAIFYYFVLKTNWKQSFFLSFVCNLVSYLAGLWLMKYFI